MPRKQRAGTSAPESNRLDPERIVKAALAVADREGLSGMTLRKVGAELGVDPTAVYRHFASKEHLLEAMADRLFGGVVEVKLAPDWRTRLEDLLRGGRNIYRRHSAIVEVLAAHPEDSPEVVHINELLLGCLREAGLDDQDIGLFHQLLVSFAIGSGVLEAGWLKPGREDREAARRAYSALDPRVNPLSSALAPHMFPPGDESFDLALGILLDAVEARSQHATARGNEPRRAPSRRPGPTTPANRATTTRRTKK